MNAMENAIYADRLDSALPYCRHGLCWSPYQHSDCDITEISQNWPNVR